jgi:hypothetical protein
MPEGCRKGQGGPEGRKAKHEIRNWKIEIRDLNLCLCLSPAGFRILALVQRSAVTPSRFISSE